MLERAIESALTREVLKRGGRSIKLSAPSDRGWPDRLVLMPGGVAGFVELKAPGKKATALQLHRLQILAELGFVTAVADSASSIASFLDRLGGFDE